MNHGRNLARRVLITAGPTREYLDPVRFLSNGSSGKMGYALAAAAVARGWIVDLVSGPVSLELPQGVSFKRVVSAADMLEACEERFPRCDLFISVAAIADYRPKQIALNKIKKTGEPFLLELLPTVDVLKSLAARKSSEQLVVGFAAETENIEDAAKKKLAEKRLDWIVANDISIPGLGIGAEDNSVILFGKNGERLSFGPAAKSAVAEFLLTSILG